MTHKAMLSSLAGLVAFLVLAVAANVLPAGAQEAPTPASCGITVYAGGALVWAPLPCGALTPLPDADTPLPTVQASATPTATWTPSPTLTPSATATRTPSPTPAPFLSPTPQTACVLTTEGSYNVNLRSGPGTEYGAIGSWAANAQRPVHRWIRNLRGEMWVNVDIGGTEGFAARWVLRLVNPDECADEILVSGQ